MQIANFLIKNDAKMIIVACNTATAMALEVLKNNFKDIPIIGVIEPRFNYTNYGDIFKIIL